MNLKENYERLFGKMPEHDRLDHTKPANKTVPIKLTESEVSKWNKIHRAFQAQFPTKTISQKNGNVYIGSRLVESVSTFLKRDNKSIVNIIKSNVQSLKD